MKRILYGFVVLMLAGFSIFLSACDENTDYWMSTKDLVIEFMEDEDYSFLLSQTDAHITYGEQLEIHVYSSEIPNEYTELDTKYLTMLDNLLVMFKTHYTNLSIKPLVLDNTTKDYYLKFEERLASFKAAINTFVAKKDSFEVLVNQNFESSQALSELKKFKRNFADLLYNASAFNESFERLYTHAYIKFPSTEQTSYTYGSENLIATVTINKMLRSYVAFVFDDSQNTIIQGSSTKILDNIALIKQALTTSIEQQEDADEEVLLQKINNLLYYTKIFDNEVEQFYSSLSNVNFFEYSKNPTQYLNANANQNSYIQKINRYNDTIIPLYAGKVIDLFN